MDHNEKMDKGKVLNYLSFMKTDKEEGYFSLKNGSFFVARVHHFEYNKNRLGVKNAVHFNTDHFDIKQETDDGQVFKRNRFIIDADNIVYANRIPSELTSYYSDLEKLSKQCIWADLPKKGSLTARNKFMDTFEEKIPSQRGDELLIEAIEKGYTEALPALNQNHAVVGRSLLSRVIKSVQPKVLKWYFENKKVELSEDDKTQLLIDVCKIGNMETIQFLIEKGFDINSIYSYEYTNERKEKYMHELAPIHELIEACQEDIFKWLFEENKIHLTLKHFVKACMSINGEFIAEIMIPHIPENNKQQFLDQGLQNSAYTNKYDLFEKLLGLGANINYLESEGKPMLFTAAENDNRAFVKLMIRAGINVNVAIYKGVSALEIAKEKNREEIVKLLTEAGAAAVEKSAEKVVEYLENQKSKSMDAAEFKKHYNKQFNPFLKSEGFKCDGFIAYKTIPEKAMAFYVKFSIDRGIGRLFAGAHPLFLPDRSNYKFTEKDQRTGNQYLFNIHPKYKGEKDYIFIDYRFDEQEAANALEICKEIYEKEIKPLHTAFDSFPIPFTTMSLEEFKENAISFVTELGMNVFHTPPSLMREICLLFARINLYYDKVSRAKEYAELCRFWNMEEFKANERISKPNENYESCIDEILKENKEFLPVSRF